MIPPTSLTFVQFSRCSPSLASPPSLHCIKMSGRATPVGPAHQRGRLSSQALTYMLSKRAAQHGCVACVAADTRRPSAVYGHAGTKNSQPRRWRGYRIRPRRHRYRRRPPIAVADVGPLLLYRTCFWAGDTFAPNLRVRDGVPIQRFLQDAFLDMWETVVRAVGDLDSVLGFEVRCLTSP